MLRNIFLPAILILLGYGFWLSPDFKEIAAGVSLFLFGMISLEEGFRAFSGGPLEKVLRKTTDRVWKSISFGVVSTTIMQSSSLVSVITISFLSAGLLGLNEGIGIIFGANLGTTTGAWLVAAFGLKVKISAYAMPMLVFGVILILQNHKGLKGAGYILSGLGFLFLGIHFMKEGFEAFKETIDLAEFAVGGFKGLMLFTGIGVFATVVMQSSHATLVLIITALAAGQITYENALALAIGANIGTTITAIIGSLSANVDGKRLAGAHLLFNMATGAIAIVFIDPFIKAVDAFSAQVGVTADDFTLKLAIFHTLFNLVGVLVMLPFIRPIGWLLHKILREPAKAEAQPRFLSMATIEIPGALVENVRKEVLRLFDIAMEIIVPSLNLELRDIRSDGDMLELARQRRKVIDVDIDSEYERRVKGLYVRILEFISEAQPRLEPEYTQRLFELRLAARRVVEAVKEIQQIRKNIIAYANADNEAVREAYDKIRTQVALALRGLHEIEQESDEEDALTVISLDHLKAEIKGLDALAEGGLDRLIRNHVISGAVASSIINDSAFASAIALRLMELGETIFVSPEEERLRQIQMMLKVDDDEIDALLEEEEAAALAAGAARPDLPPLTPTTGRAE